MTNLEVVGDNQGDEEGGGGNWGRRNMLWRGDLTQEMELQSTTLHYRQRIHH